MPKGAPIMIESEIPDLTFPMIHYGKFEVPLDLRSLLYQGGAGTNAKIVSKFIADGKLGMPIANRQSLVIKIHEFICGKLVEGGSRESIKTTIRRLREFYIWVDMAQRPITLDSVETLYIEWTDYLLHKQRIVCDIAEIHVYQCAVAVAKVFDEILQFRSGLLSKTRIRRPKHFGPILGTTADKQNLEQAFIFGQSLLDITEALSADSIRGSLPVTIRFRTGKVIEEWTKLRPPDLLKTLKENIKSSTRLHTINKRIAWEADNSVRTRHVLINLRIESEMLIFIAQTGMNLEQVHTLKMGRFRYRSHLDGYEVHRVYKGRRHGEVAFEIFSEYREFFERYLSWRGTIFPDDEGLLFPLITVGRETQRPHFSMVKKYCKKLDIRFIPPRELRKTRINWLLRRSKDPAMVAEMHAHTQETLIKHYEQPSLQIALVEINRFHMRTDPSLTPPGPGLCVEALPQAIQSIPAEATVPDCISPAGCLFCTHQRDIDSADYVWSLISYRHLKSLELAGYRSPIKSNQLHPAAIAVERITNKLNNLKQSNDRRRLWVIEALARIEENYYHPRWEGFIRLMELRT